ncbi:sugar phosphate isomerase/epimerase [Niabella sp. CC-SYL272]|uniref:sugar phosphate isomerase/epimerase family protein n=1 Tax=Niabella agricola TaxID=2891571 RepID=UPI001F1EA200|nr:sugar phosphate isomerase/epimerase [Niabella agricola]MCF3107938.1 sugar phosphate isomerase/epimerase [Niabella agricola]
MYNRKEFLKRSGGAALGLMLGSTLNAACTPSSRMKAAGSIKAPGIQLYSLRDDLPKDPKGILKQLAAFGYKEIESYEGAQGMFWGMGHKGFKAYMDELGMKIVSSHCDFRTDFERKAAEAAAIGMRYLICPYVGPQKTLDEYKKLADEFNMAGEICKKNGIRFAYHNHDYSFRQQEGQYPQDIFMQHTDQSLMDYEMDIYWVVTAGQDPVAWLKKYNGRFKLCHVKDRKKGAVPQKGEPNLSVIVGTGSIDFKTILAAARAAGMEHYILEQEAYEKAPIECVKEGAAYLNKLVF